MTACVYTAIAGDYESLKQAPLVDDVDCIAFVDRPFDPEWPIAAGWELRPMEFHAPTHRMRAKFYKVFPTAVLPEYDRSVWTDASVEWHGPWFIEQLLRQPSQDLLMLAHPERDCIYDEAVASLGMPKYDGEPLLDQVAMYWRARHPRHWGLWAGTVIKREHNDLVHDTMSDWWRHIQHWSIQDQLSLPFVLRHRGLRPTEVYNMNLYDNDSFKVHFQPEAR